MPTFGPSLAASPSSATTISNLRPSTPPLVFISSTAILTASMASRPTCSWMAVFTPILIGLLSCAAAGNAVAANTLAAAAATHGSLNFMKPSLRNGFWQDRGSQPRAHRFRTMRRMLVELAFPHHRARQPQSNAPDHRVEGYAAEMLQCRVRFSNRPAEVKRFQTVHGSGVDVTRGLVLLSGIGTQALPLWDSRTRWDDLLGGLAVSRSKRTRELTSSIVPRGTPFHYLWSSGFLLLRLISLGAHEAAASLVQRNSVPSTQM